MLAPETAAESSEAEGTSRRGWGGPQRCSTLGKWSPPPTQACLLCLSETACFFVTTPTPQPHRGWCQLPQCSSEPKAQSYTGSHGRLRLGDSPCHLTLPWGLIRQHSLPSHQIDCSLIFPFSTSALSHPSVSNPQSTSHEHDVTRYYVRSLRCLGLFVTAPQPSLS